MQTQRRKGIFARTLIAFLLLSTIGAVFVSHFISRAIRESHIERLSEELLRHASLIAGTVNLANTEGLDEYLKEIKTKSGISVTVIAPDGTVLGDSDLGSATMGNQTQMPEIREALHSGSGTAIRSNSEGKGALFVALRTAEDVATIVRVAEPLDAIDTAVGRLRAELMLTGGLLLTLITMFSIWQMLRFRGLLRQVSDFAASLAGGDLEKRLFFEGEGELGIIAANLNSMATELKSMIRQSAEEKDHLNAILRSIPDALLVLDARGIISMASAASRGFFGFKEPITGKPFMEVVKVPEFYPLLEKAGKSHSTEEAEAKLGQRHLIIRVSPLIHPKQGVIAVFHDVTEAKRLEQMRKDFVANVSHEIKTPVTAIKGFADTLLDGAIDDRETALRFIRTIKSNSERLNSLVDDLMTISKLELGVTKIERSKIDPAEAIEAVRLMLAETALKKGLYLKTSVSADIGTISADRDRLIQILTNLVDNAIKFTETGGVTIGLMREDGSSVLYVEDTGIGIPSRHLPRLGERFYRVDESRSRGLGGTGLGLAIVKHIVRAHGWKMKIESREGKGTKVKIFVD